MYMKNCCVLVGNAFGVYEKLNNGSFFSVKSYEMVLCNRKAYSFGFSVKTFSLNGGSFENVELIVKKQNSYNPSMKLFSLNGQLFQKFFSFQKVQLLNVVPLKRWS